MNKCSNIPYILSCYLQIDADADPDQVYHFDPDPYPASHFDADLDPTFQFDADPSGSGSTTLMSRPRFQAFGNLRIGGGGGSSLRIEEVDSSSYSPDASRQDHVYVFTY